MVLSSPDERHIPVLCDRVVALLQPAVAAAGDAAVIVDATVGLGGHAVALLDEAPGALLIGLDRDPEALRLAATRLASHGDRVRLVHAVFDQIADVLASAGLDGADAVLFDLGVSSLQLDEAVRGFSYAHDAPLDMRMDATAGRTAADVLNSYSVPELARVLRDYGEERFATRVAKAIVAAREAGTLQTTGQLAELVRDAIPAATRRHGGHPAKRTFQALRIEVNGELDALRRALPAAIGALRLHGRIAVLSYHSLEDRIVKRALAERLRGCVCPPDLPVCGCGHEPELRLLTRGDTPTPEERSRNPRAASARLRAAERVRVAA